MFLLEYPRTSDHRGESTVNFPNPRDRRELPWISVVFSWGFLAAEFPEEGQIRGEI